MRKVWNFRRTRPVAGIMAVLCLLLWQSPPAAAFYRPKVHLMHGRTQTPDTELRQRIEAKEKSARREPDVRELSAAEMQVTRGRGQYRNAAFNGVLPWQRSFRDVNLCNGNLFKSFTDIQVSSSRGLGLALQRNYNSNDERVGPFGVGWTHNYDIRINEGENNNVPRTDFFGGKLAYKRDADGLYSPPSYLHDELSSDYDQFLADGPPEILSDDQKGMDGTVKHFVSGGTDTDGSPSSERVIDSITDRHGNQTTFTYGFTQSLGGLATKKLLTRVTDPSGRYLDFTWSNLGTSVAPAYRITMAQGPFDANNTPIYTVTYEYNSEHNLWKVHQDPNGLNRITTFTYTTVAGEAGLLASISDPLNHTVTYSYGLQSLSYQSTPTGTLWVLQVTEPGSGGPLVWDIVPDLTWSGAFSVAINPYNSTPGFCVCVDDHLRCTMMLPKYGAASNPVHELLYDTENNVVTRWSHRWMTDVYPGDHEMTTTICTYGPHGNVLTQRMDGFPNSTVITSYYDASKYFQKASVTDANGNTTTFDYYDNADPNLGNRGEVKWVRDARYGATSQQFEYTYNSYGQKLTEINLNDVVTEYTYGDTWGNLTQMVQDPGTGHLNRTTQTTHDVAGRVVSSTDPRSQTSSFAFNGLGQPTSATLPGETVSYNYGANGRLDSVTDGRGTTTMTYESGNDRVASVTDPVTGTVSYTYTPIGRTQTMTLPGGGTWTYSYGTAFWHALVAPSDQPDHFTYPLTSVTDDQGRIVEYRQDAMGHCREVLYNQSFDAGGNRVSYCKTTYAYENANTTLYSTYGSGSKVTRGNLRQVQNTWNWFDPTTYQWQSSVLVQNDYTYDNQSNRLTNTLSDNSGPIRTETYGYDGLNRLTTVNYGDGTTQGYTFDPMGNRLTRTQNGVTENYSYNNANMLLSQAGSTYTNDANGNTLAGGGRTNTWDGLNRLTQCVASTNTSSFVYGSDGLRRQATVNGTTTDYVLDGQNVVRERQGSSNTATYLHGARGPEYRRNDSTGVVRWYLYDGLGSVLGEVDGSGNITASEKYDVYGAVRSSTGTSTSTHGFAGNLGHSSEDETGLIYMRARYMDPVTGRFVSEDPAKDGKNWFAYVASNPTNVSDPTGLFMLIDLMGGGLDGELQDSYDALEARAAQDFSENALERAMFRWAENYGELFTEEFESYGVSEGRLDLIQSGNDRIAIDFSGHGGSGPHLNAYGKFLSYLEHFGDIGKLLK